MQLGRPGTHPLPADACSCLGEVESPVCGKTGSEVKVALTTFCSEARQLGSSSMYRRHNTAPSLCRRRALGLPDIAATEPQLSMRSAAQPY